MSLADELLADLDEIGEGNEDESQVWWIIRAVLFCF